MLLDIDYLLLGMPGIALSLWAQWQIVSACSAASRLPASSGLTGSEAARRLMQASGVRPVDITPASGQLSNHYDPSRKVLRLSQYSGPQKVDHSGHLHLLKLFPFQPP